MKVYNKLVRDKIPQIIEEKGKKAEFRVLSDVEYRTMLDLKLHEELLEFIHANEEDQVEELADLIEVVYAILERKGVSIEDFEKVRLAKKEKRGGFEEKLFLVGVEENDGR
ncbi:putative house-cleaning noncanonical NTP pyrophosphatase (MazG superfamily) [Paenibacillus sp. V4I9]|uniref:nucleoside triphosphate pyrophosphohydrolase n=1 Tax=Paenibacillus sp. V4I9 TaxID=3042308 RepID=UPI00278B9C9B|nr:nucleoside triphosphate pyrophosphohydrolase [Paenibacillus sp. V4I9]MDQ0885934.1 putative house-cleaning noncanonical NTP pyrophosphatase (MazG superfamily) [Paenibacillus sp. V4I9]